MAHDGERKVARLLLVPEADEVGGVLAVVVADENLVDPRDEVARDAVQHLRERRRRVVRDDQDPDPLHVLSIVAVASSAFAAVGKAAVTAVKATEPS